MAQRSDATPRPERIAAHFTGLSAESRAAAYLVAKGYRIVARRFRTPVGEVDIVARRRGVLVFVEVKARSNLDDAAFSLLPRQQQRIAAAAGAWLAAHRLACLGLPFRRRHGQAVEFVRNLDLARQPRIRPHVEAEIQHVLFHRGR